MADGDEAIDGTDPLNPDSDGDGADDGDEATDGTDPLTPDSDGDGAGGSDGGAAPEGAIIVVGKGQKVELG